MTNEELKKKVEPDGYCAYREDGTLIKGELQICVTTRRQAWNFKRAKDNNYIIKPVWLSDTPPVSKEVLEELSRGDGIYYIAQERAMAPGIVGEWPEVIKHPTNPHGRLVKRQWNKAILLEKIKGER